MLRKENYSLYKKLRSQHTWFSYDGFDSILINDEFCVTYHFSMDGGIVFNPQLKIPSNCFTNISIDNLDSVRSILFHIGMIELLSYWKVVCAPNVIIKNTLLNKEQITWFKKVYFNGLGEFFYLNGIDASIDDFMHITCEGTSSYTLTTIPVTESVLIPVGGGKDSVVTLELMKKMNVSITCFLLNPRLANKECVEVAGFDFNKSISFKRSIDPTLLQLNKNGYLNGHTPFSALLAFITVFAAAITGKKYIALSNESSANEPTVGTANHQYSKSFEFEYDFRTYMSLYITKDIEYFSFLRPLSELQIASLFATFPAYFKVFKSCNVGSKTDVWCGVCSKCLFAYIILSPFINKNTLIEIFGRDLLDDKNMQFYFNQLTGIADEKPFECIGTVEEVNIALCMLVANYGSSQLPVLLQEYISSDMFKKYSSIDSKVFLTSFNIEHVLKVEWLQLIKKSVHEAVS